MNTRARSWKAYSSYSVIPQGNYICIKLNHIYRKYSCKAFSSGNYLWHSNGFRWSNYGTGVHYGLVAVPWYRMVCLFLKLETIENHSENSMLWYPIALQFFFYSMIHPRVPQCDMVFYDFTAFSIWLDILGRISTITQL